MAASRLTKLLRRPMSRRRLRTARTGRNDRRLQIELLEDRRLLAVGPTLVAVVPNSGVFLNNNDVVNVAPRELTFRFAQGNSIGPNTLAGGFIVKGAGLDRTLGTADDVTITPGFLGMGDTAREVVMRFASNLPDDAYQVTLVGTGATPLRDTNGNRFNDGADQSLVFTVDLGTKVVAVVPQPISRAGNGTLTQNFRVIDVYFDRDQLPAAEVQKPGYYRLINAATGAITLPASVTYTTDPLTRQAKASLLFAADLPAGTFKLEVGTTSEPTVDERISLAQPIAGSMASPWTAFLGDALTLSGASQVNDVDLYRFDLRSDVSDFSVVITPQAGLNTLVRIFDANGTELTSAPISSPINNGGPGAADARSGLALTAGTYYIGVSSAGNASYNPLTGAGASGGSATGSYTIQVTFSDLPATSEPVDPSDPSGQTKLDINSSFATATPLGVLGLAGRSVSGAIEPARYTIQFPGAGDAPGERTIPFQSHILTLPGELPDGTPGIRTITYDFQTIYGFTPQGQPFFNAITEPQKQRAREALELWSRYLGVQFREVDPDQIADMTIATGDPRAVAPTISTGTGTSGTGVSGISGVLNVPPNADVSGLLTSVSGPVTATSSSLGGPFALSGEVVVTSPSHGLTTGAVVRVQGVQGTPGANGVWTVTVLDANRFQLNGSTFDGVFTGAGTWTLVNVSRGVAIANALENWGNSEFGGSYFRTIMHQIGHLLGLGDNYEAPALTIMGGGETPSQAPNVATAERVFPGDADIVYGQAVHRPESRDIDLYQFTIPTSYGPGLLRAETVVERLPASSLLNTVLTLYRETQVAGKPVRTMIARNDDYYGNDSYLELRLEPGTYYVAVTSVGNTDFDPTIPGTGLGGRTKGAYDLKLQFKPDAATTTIKDNTTSSPAFDGDGDGRPGGTYVFYFQANTPANTIYVDKSNTQSSPNGTLANPYNNLATALSAAAGSATRKIVRIVGNGGADGDLTTLGDNLPYLVGYKDQDLILDEPLEDGATFLVPPQVTVMIDGGAIFKLRKANLNAGTTPQGLLSLAGGAIQVLGTPARPVQFTSYADDTIGGDSDGPLFVPQGGDWGGIVFRDDSDHERDFLSPPGSPANPFSLVMPVFLNYVTQAVLTYGGGRVVVDSVEEVYNPIHLDASRPTISFNRITRSADAALSAKPNAFDDDGLVPAIPFDARRLGPDIHDNWIVNNTLNGLFLRVRTPPGNPIEQIDVPTRWRATDVVYVVAENLQIAGTPAGSRSPGADRPQTLLTDGRLRIDPGVIVKLGGARIEAQISSQFLAEGTLADPIIFTSLKDDRYGAGGTFDTNRDGSASGPAPGQWGGLVLGPASSASLDQVRVFYAGGPVPIEGGFDRFNAVEIQQADVRIANSIFQFNDAGGSQTDRNGRGINADAVIFIRGAQPVIVNNIFRDNQAPVLSVNANALQSAVVGDWGRSTGGLTLAAQTNDNRGPLVRGNRLSNNRINGMVVRGGVLTTETVWDDVDIAHVLTSEITVLNHQVFSGLRLQSSPTQSLVVKLQGATAGFTADGTPLDIQDRIGGTVQVIGQPGRPVILTSLADDTVSGGFDPSGLPLFDTNNDGNYLAVPTAARPAAGDWRSISLNRYSNDRNVGQVLEAEPAYLGATDMNGTPATAQFLGSLAPSLRAGDDNRRLGFEVIGTIAWNRPSDVDVYSFTADSGTEVWIDIDRTSYGLDAMVELVDLNGNVIARATDTTSDIADPHAVAPPPDPGLDEGLPAGAGRALSFNKDPFNGRDTFTTNPRDPILRVILPKAANGNNLINSPWFVRVRSQPATLEGQFTGNAVYPGLTSGVYQLQIRLRQKDEKPGSTVRFADLRYATNGIEVHGLPSHSPLAGETVEADDAANDTFAGAQNLGNLLRTDRNTLSVGGTIGRIDDVDWYRFDLTFDLLQFVNNYSDGLKSWSTIFDLDYADGLSRGNLSISVFDSTGRLILLGRDSNVKDDQAPSGQSLAEGSFGKLDPWVGPVQLPTGNPGQIRTYYVAVHSDRTLPSVLNQTFTANPTDPGVRLEPIDAIARMADDHIEAFTFAVPTSSGTAEFPSNQYIDPVLTPQTGKTRSTLLDASTVKSLSANVKPFTLADVPLFVSSRSQLFLIDGVSGATEVAYAPGRSLASAGGNFVEDIAFRSDGLFYAYEGGFGGVANTAGGLSQIDTGVGTASLIGQDQIPDFTNPPQPPEQITTNLAAGAAMAIGGTVIGNLQQNTLLYYAVPDPAAQLSGPQSPGPDLIFGTPDDGQPVALGTTSRLYRADPTNGSAAVVQGQPWGRVGGANHFISRPVNAIASTNFGVTGSPVIVTFSALPLGPAGNGIRVAISNSDLGQGALPQISTNNTTRTVSITLNSNQSPSAASGFTDFGTGFDQVNGTGSAIQFTASSPGAAGNSIRIVFTPSQDLTASQLAFGTPIVQVNTLTSTITVTLDNDQAGGGNFATTVQQLADAINNAASTLVTASALGDSSFQIGRPPGSYPPISFFGGSDGGAGSTVADLIAAINQYNQSPPTGETPLISASFTGNSATPIGLIDPLNYPNPLTLSGGRISVGVTTGMTFGSDNQTLYGVTDQGVFLIDIGDGGGPGGFGPAAPARTVLVRIPSRSNPNQFIDAPFSAVTRGPQNLENGRYADMFFATTSDGQMVALDANGQLQNVFDTNADGVADSAVVSIGIPNPTGIAFSPFDFNLWHPTFRRQDDPGHDVGPSPTNATTLFSLSQPASGRGSDSVNMSFYFGMELANPGLQTDSYQTYTLSGNFVTGTGDTQLQPHLGQYGQLSSQRQRELTNTASNGGIFSNNYNMPGGAYGSLITDPFSLSGLTPEDKPTIYFDYFLSTEGQNSSLQTGRMRDSARVYIGPFLRNDPVTGQTYETWELLATNNSVLDSPGTGAKGQGLPLYDGELPTFISASTTALPANPRQQVQELFDNTSNWRQARVDLSRYAGLSNLRIRFDFSTAGQMPDKRGQLPATSTTQAARQGNGEFLEENNYAAAQGLASATRGQNNTAEGFYVDNIIVGVAERGEMVINAPVNTSFFTTPQPQNLDATVPAPTQVFTGPYQLEIRRGTEYGVSDGGPFGGVNVWRNSQTAVLKLDTNERLIPDQRLDPNRAIPLEDFESSPPGSGAFDAQIPWNQTDDAAWSIVDLSTIDIGGVTGSTFGAGSGPIGNGQRSGLTVTLVTGGGNLTFTRAVSSEANFDFLRLYIDGRVARDINGQPTEWSGDVPFGTVVVPISAGHHTFTWVYEKDASGAAGLDRAFVDDISFPTPLVGVMNIYEDRDLHDPTSPRRPPIPPTVPPPASLPAIQNLDSLYGGIVRVGDQNLERPQGQLILEQNSIDQVANVGILVDAGPRDPGSNRPFAAVRNLPTLNNDRLVPGATIVNNVISNFGQAGIVFAGDANTQSGGQSVPVAAVPFGRIVNNTIYGGANPAGTRTAGIQVGANAGPTLLNNIIANSDTGIVVDPTSTATTVIGANLFAGNTNNGPLGTNAIVLPAGAPLFVNPANRNFYLVAGSPAIDSSLNSLADRPSIAAVRSAVGIAQSPILAPERDQFGQLRVDDPNAAPPPGLGVNIFKDRGAIERADFSRPTAAIVDPLDNDPANRDRNRALNDVAIRNENLTQFVIRLSDVGVGIDDSTVTSSQFTVTRDGVVLSDQTGATPDYFFVYNATTDEAIFLPTAGVWPLNHTYTIKLNNTPIGAVGPGGNPLPPGILDLAGNPVAANRSTGETLFSVFVGTLYDFGDAPLAYPVTLAENGAAHVVVDGFRLGPTITEESDGQHSAAANADSGDDGVTFTSLAAGVNTTVIVNAVVPAGTTAYLDAWFDLNQDGDWDDPGEKLIDRFPLVNGNNTVPFRYGNATALRGTTFARFRLSSTGTSSPRGIAPDGEVEDYRVTVAGPPFQNPANNLDVNNDTFVAPIDALLAINYLNIFNSMVAGASIPLPPTSPPFPAPPPVLDPTGGGVRGNGLFLDVNGDGFLTPIDPLLVINFLNSRIASGGEGEGEAPAVLATAASPPPPPAIAASSRSALAAGNVPTIPPVLLAAPNVVLELRPQMGDQAAAPPLLSSSSSSLLDPRLVSPELLTDVLQQPALRHGLDTWATKKDEEGSEDWEELLDQLAADQLSAS